MSRVPGRGRIYIKSVSPEFLVDTNILVYAYDTGEEAKQIRAEALLLDLERTSIGSLSAQIMGEFFNTVTRKLTYPLTGPDAERRLSNFANSWTVFEISRTTVLEAIRGAQRYQLSYWDGLIWATAKLNGVPCVLSEDFSDGILLEGVRFRNPLLESFVLV